MADVQVSDDLWATNLMQLGWLDCWRVPDGSQVSPGEAIAEVTVEDARHEVLSPVSGRLAQTIPAGWVVAPGCVIGHISE